MVTAGRLGDVVDWSVNQYPACGKVPTNPAFFGLCQKSCRATKELRKKQAKRKRRPLEGGSELRIDSAAPSPARFEVRLARLAVPPFESVQHKVKMGLNPRVEIEAVLTAK